LLTGLGVNFQSVVDIVPGVLEEAEVSEDGIQVEDGCDDQEGEHVTWTVIVHSIVHEVYHRCKQQRQRIYLILLVWRLSDENFRETMIDVDVEEQEELREDGQENVDVTSPTEMVFHGFARHFYFIIKK
jgi:hypothetical protein